MSAPPQHQQSLHVMSKPIGPICNLDCEYCYYLHKEELYPKGEHWRMPEQTLETYIRQYIDAQPQGIQEITFAWQGGEPTLLGLPFFQRVVAVQKQYRPVGKRIVNTLQTNGVLLTEEWCRFFKQEDFLVGLSLDGPAEFHDRYRYDHKREPTFQKVLRALKLLKAEEVEFNVLVVVNRHNGDHGRRVYTYLRDCGARFFQFIPIVERRNIGRHPEGSMESTDSRLHPWEHLVSSRSVLPEQFGQFLVDVFEEWIRRDVGRVFVQLFDQALSAWMGIEPSLCVFRKRCGSALALEHNGDLYSCDHFVEPEYKLGNIHEMPIVELAYSTRQLAFGEQKESSLPEYCRQCEVLFACNGECPKNRFIPTPQGEPGLNYLCAGYRRFFNHITHYMEQMRTALRRGQPAAMVMEQFRKSRTSRTEILPGKERSSTSLRKAKPNRNELCPCGSGKKFKKCCQRIQ